MVGGIASALTAAGLGPASAGCGGQRAWHRPTFAPGGGPGALFVASFLPTAGFVIPPITRAHGLPGSVSDPDRPDGLPAWANMVHVRRDRAEDWFDGLLTGGMRACAEMQMTDAGLEALDACHSCVVFSGEVADPPDLVHLQVAWAVRRALAEAGAVVHLDVPAALWDDGRRLEAQPVASGFDVRNEVLVFVERDTSVELGGLHAAYTRGMRKFGRPDVMLALPSVAPAALDRATDDLFELADRMAAGAQIAAGDVVKLASGGRNRAVRLSEGRNAPEIGLQNGGVLLVPA